MAETNKVVRKTKDASEARSLEVKRSSDSSYRTVYSNNTQIAVSYFDIRILFGEASSIEEHALNVVDKVAVYMSPEHAGVFHKLLGRQLEIYNERFGNLRPEPGVEHPLP